MVIAEQRHYVVQKALARLQQTRVLTGLRYAFCDLISQQTIAEGKTYKSKYELNWTKQKCSKQLYSQTSPTKLRTPATDKRHDF